MSDLPIGHPTEAAPDVAAADRATANGTATSMAALRNYQPRDSGQAQLQGRFLELLASVGELAMVREHNPAHLTASALIVDPVADRVLLVLHNKVKRWLQTGGHVEPGEDLATAALREAREESGIHDLVLGNDIVDLDIHQAPCGAQEHWDVRFLAVAPTHATPVVSDESDDVAWFAADAIPGDDPTVTRLVSLRHLAGQ